MYRYLINYFLPIVHTQGVIFYCYLFFFSEKSTEPPAAPRYSHPLLPSMSEGLSYGQLSQR